MLAFFTELKRHRTENTAVQLPPEGELLEVRQGMDSHVSCHHNRRYRLHILVVTSSSVSLEHERQTSVAPHVAPRQCAVAVRDAVGVRPCFGIGSGFS